MAANGSAAHEPQSLVTDDFLYFYLRLRKQRVRAVVQAMRSRFPDESREQLARRIIASHLQLSALGGSLIQLPLLVPGLGQALKVLGFVGGLSAFARAHIYLILEIALLYDRDIDDQERVPEIMTVVAGAAMATATPPLLMQAAGLSPWLSLPVAVLAAATLTQLVGERAIQHYTGILADTSTATPVQHAPNGANV